MAKQPAVARPVAFVTGASYGIGAATALALAQDGYDVAIAATRLSNLDKTISALEAAGAMTTPVVLDLKSQTSIEQALQDVIKGHGRVDVLVNNAGITIRRPAADIARDEWEEVMRTNVDGTFFMCQQMGRHLIAAKRPGCIINIASAHAFVGYAQRSAYGVSKAAIVHITKMLAVEWAEHGIRVNAVAPGRVTSGSPLRASTSSDEKYIATVHSRIPLKRSATSEEVASAVRYLASPGAGYITGHTLLLDGGVTAQ